MGLFTRKNSASSKGTSSPDSSARSTSSRPRAVVLGQHPTKVQAVIKLLEQSDQLQVVAGVSDMMDAAVVLKAMHPPVDLFICGAYFDIEEAREIVASIGGELQLIKVPDGLMMEGGGPMAVIGYITTEIRRLRRDSGGSWGRRGSDGSSLAAGH